MNKLAVLAKMEAVQGTEAAPVAADAIQLSDVNITPLEGDTVENNIIRPYFGNSGSTLVSQYSKITFKVPAAGVATAGAMPGYAALLRACGMAVTTTAATNVRFDPVTNNMESLTLYANLDGVLQKMLGCVGTVKLTTDAKSIPQWEFEMTGSFVLPTDMAMPTVNYAAFVEPLGVNKTNTTLTLDGLALPTSNFSFDIGNTVVKRDLINLDTQLVTNRKSTASITFEAHSMAFRNWITAARASARVPLVLTHGLGATNQVQLNALRAQVGKPSYSEQDGIQMITLPLDLIPSATGNDEFSIVIK
jgi:hypothetical protein